MKTITAGNIMCQPGNNLPTKPKCHFFIKSDRKLFSISQISVEI
jgi:hypothetical protein